MSGFPLIDGKKFVWPGEAPVAFAFCLAWETWPDNLGRPESTQVSKQPSIAPTAPHPLHSPTVFDHAFAETGGVQRVVETWDQYGVRGTVYVNGRTIELYPDLVREVADRGHEISAEAWDHEYFNFMSEVQQRESVQKTVDIFKSVLGVAPPGFVSAGGRYTPQSFDILADAGFDWVAGASNTDTPYVRRRKGKRPFVTMGEYLMSDYLTYSETSWSPRQVCEMAMDELLLLIDEGRRGYPRYAAYGTHAYLARAFRMRPYAEFVERVLELDGVWVTTQHEIATWILSEYPDMTLDKLYPNSAEASDRNYDLWLGVSD